MGTRADFYVGRGTDAIWLGSVAWDGGPDGYDTPFWLAETESQFRGALAKVAEERDDWIAPERGWPWPWDTSSTTDWAYAFDDGKVYGTYTSHWWVIDGNEADPYAALEEDLTYGSEEYRTAEAEVTATLQPTTFPDMSDRRMSHDDLMAASGLIVVEVPR